MIYNDGRAGFLTVIIGPMFSEKSGELIKQCLLSQNYQNKTVRIYKPAIDDRYGDEEVVSRIGLRMSAFNISQEITPELVRTILSDCESADLVAFDEAQFFSEGLMDSHIGPARSAQAGDDCRAQPGLPGAALRLHRAVDAPCG